MDNNFGLDLRRVMRKVLDIKRLIAWFTLSASCLNRTLLQLASLRLTSAGMFYRFSRLFLNLSGLRLSFSGTTCVLLASAGLYPVCVWHRLARAIRWLQIIRSTIWLISKNRQPENRPRGAKLNLTGAGKTFPHVEKNICQYQRTVPVLRLTFSHYEETYSGVLQTFSHIFSESARQCRNDSVKLTQAKVLT